MGKCTPITQKAKSSPFPADADLIAGAADIGASKIKGDYGKLLQEGFDEGMAAKEAMQDDLITSDYYPETEEESEENANSGQADDAPEPNE